MIDAHMGIGMLPEDLNPVICARNETSGLLQRVNCHEILMTGMCARKSESDCNAPVDVCREGTRTL